MGLIRRLFGKEEREASPSGATPTGQQGPSGTAEPEDPAAPAPIATTAAVPAPPTASPEPTPAPPIPLKSLETFRQDPAFKNFMDRARRPPGTVGRPRRPDRD